MTLRSAKLAAIKKKGEEDFFSIGGGYLETDGKNVNLLVSRTYGQDKIDEKEVEKAKAQAEQDLKDAPTEQARHEAFLNLHRSIVDLKVLRKRNKASRQSL